MKAPHTNSGHLGRVIPASEHPAGWAQSSIELISQPSFSLCPIRLLTFPHTGVKPNNAPVSPIYTSLYSPPSALLLLGECSMPRGLPPCFPLECPGSWRASTCWWKARNCSWVVMARRRGVPRPNCQTQYGFSLWFWLCCSTGEIKNSLLSHCKPTPWSS